MQQISPSSTDRSLGGRYRLSALIATGGMSTVHRAWDVLMQRPVAIKLYAPNQDPAALLRFRDEARTLAGLSDSGLVAVYDTGTDGERPYLVLQLIDGPTLRERLADGPLDAAEVRTLGAQLARTLAYVHSQGVIHRDVKPSNVLLGTDGTPYLADFGICRVIDSARVTGSGQFVGTAGYLAPEQVRGLDGGSAVDIYALGLVLLECLTGRAEYTGSDVVAAVARLSRPPRIPDDVPADLAQLIRSMTAASPEHRPTAAECAAALAGQRPVTALIPRHRPRQGRLRQGRLSQGRLSQVRLRERGVLAAAATVTALAAGAGWSALSGAEPIRPAPVESAPAASLVGTVTDHQPATVPPATVPPEPAPPAVNPATEAPAAAVQRQPARDKHDDDDDDDKSGSGSGKKGGKGKKGRG